MSRSSAPPSLLTRPSLAALKQQAPDGPLSRLPERIQAQLLDISELIGAQPGHSLVSQYHKQNYFYFLISGEVEFRISLQGAGRDFPVGSSSTPWTPIGWSAFRAPYRYATTVTPRRYSEFLRFSLDELEEVFDGDPVSSAQFFSEVASQARQLLHHTRTRLAGHVPALSNSLPPQLPNGSHSAQAPIRSEESMVTNAAPTPREVMDSGAFFRGLPEGLIENLVEISETRYFCRGDQLLLQDSESEGLAILASGRVRLEYTPPSREMKTLGFVQDAGLVVSAHLPGIPFSEGLTVRAVRDGALAVIPAAPLAALLSANSEWGADFARRVLWLLSRQLRRERARLISRELGRDHLAIENVIEQVRTELSVSSPLFKLPHLLGSTVTLADAIQTVDAARKSRDAVERHTANVCHELLSPVRREQRFFSSLQEAFVEVVSAPAGTDPQRLRRENAETFIRVFSQIPHTISGEENLPDTPGHIFIFNHLKNHEYNTLPNGFQLTLDSHFVSAMILHKKYRDPGVRVVRQSRAEEYGHQDYYGRLGHVFVYTPESDSPALDRNARFKEFVDASEAHLRAGNNLVLAPEGTSLATEESPGRFKAGAFRLAASVSPEPLIVPIATAYFDRRLDHTHLSAVVHEPFRISDRVSDPNNADELRAFLNEFTNQFTEWVAEARELGKGGSGEGDY